MEKAKAPRQDPERGTICNLLPRIESDAIDNYFGVLKNSAVIDGTNVQGFGTVNGHTYKWKMIIESLVKSIAVVPDRFFDITGRSYKIDQNRKISVNSLPDYENYKDAIIYKINNNIEHIMPDIPKLIYDEGDEEIKSIMQEYITITANQDIEDTPLQTLLQLINKDNTYKLYEDNLLVSILNTSNEASQEGASDETFSIDNIYMYQIDFNEPLSESDKFLKYPIYQDGEIVDYITRIDNVSNYNILGNENPVIYEVDCTPPEGETDIAQYNPVSHINYGDLIDEDEYEKYCVFIPQNTETSNNSMSLIDSSDLYSLYKLERAFLSENNGASMTEVVVCNKLTEENFIDSTSEVADRTKWNINSDVIKVSEEQYNRIKDNINETNLKNVKFLVEKPIQAYSKTIEVYKVNKESKLYNTILTNGLQTEIQTFESSLNEYLWNHRVDIMNNVANVNQISSLNYEEKISNADYLAIIVDNNDNYIPLIGVVANSNGVKGYDNSQKEEENEPLPTRTGNQLIWYNPCPKIDISQFKGIDMWLRFENLNELIYYLLTKYENNIISIDAATINGPDNLGVNRGKTTVEIQEGQEADKVKGKLWCYLNPRTMTPFPDDYWFHQGENYYIKSLTLATGDKQIKGKQIVVKAGQWPGMYMMMGESWIRNRDTGEDIHLQIKIPLCKVKSDHTLTLSADGDPTVFTIGLEVAEPVSGDLMEITAYETKTRIIENFDGKFYAVDGSSEVVIE